MVRPLTRATAPPDCARRSRSVEARLAGTTTPSGVEAMSRRVPSTSSSSAVRVTSMDSGEGIARQIAARLDASLHGLVHKLCFAKPLRSAPSMPQRRLFVPFCQRRER